MRPTRTRDLVLSALLIALSISIPLYMPPFFRIIIGPFSATLASHVPTMLAMFLSPLAAVLVGIGSTLGFLATLGPVIAARASIHIVFGLVGAVLWQRGLPAWQVLLWVLPIHAIGEALVVLPFGWTLETAGIGIGVGSALHHVADAFIALAILRAMGLPLQKFKASGGAEGTRVQQ